MAITIASRPAELDGCWSNWSEQDVDNVIRTEMDSGALKSRRRYTGRQRNAQVDVTLSSSKYQFFVQWFRFNCRSGSIPTRVKTPYGADEVWAFSAPPTFSWLDRNAVRVSCQLYQLAAWEGL